MKEIADYRDREYSIFNLFHKQNAVLTSGDILDFRLMTIGWGMMGNIWGHPGSAVTVYVHPSRFTFPYMLKKDYFTICFLPEEFHSDVITLGTHSGRDGNKLTMTKLTPIEIDHGVTFEQAELSFICRRIYASQFSIDSVPDEIRNGLYKKMEPHWMFIGSIEHVISND